MWSSKNDINRLCREFLKNILQQNGEYLDFIEDQEESIIESILKQILEQIFTAMFEDVKHVGTLVLLLSLTDPEKIKQSKVTDHEINKKKSSFRKITRTEIIKKKVAVSIVVYSFLFNKYWLIQICILIQNC